MPLKIISSSIGFNYPGKQTVEFNFQGEIRDFGVALKGFEMHYPNTDHNVENMGVEIMDTFINQDKTIVTAVVAFNFTDDEGHGGIADISLTAFADMV